MKIVVIGASGRIGDILSRKLLLEDCEIFAASPTYGVDTVSGVGLPEAFEGADIVIDVSNSHSAESAAAIRFFDTSCRNLIAAGRRVGVRHHIVLSIAGVDRLTTTGYFEAKKNQEHLVRQSGIPFTIVRSTQFFEFVRDVVQDGTACEIPVSTALVQPISGRDIADALAGAAFGDPANAVIEIAGPEQIRLCDLAAEIATAFEDERSVVPDINAPYLGAVLEERTLLPRQGAHIAPRRFDDWFRDSLQPSWARIPLD
jgi:uncharacterized protein YbjT (DUF2867 family)